MDHSYPIKTFDPLLRDLVAWGLVVRSETESEPAWHLSQVAQRRLDELVLPKHEAAGMQLVYLDHRCADCQLMNLTRLIEGDYLCQECSERRVAAESGDEEGHAAAVGYQRRWRRRREQVEGAGSSFP